MKMFNIPKEDRTLANYTKEAMCLIGRFGQPWMLKDDDVIANVVNAIVRAEWDFDPSRGVKRSTLRITYARYQIITEFRELAKWSKRPSHFSIEAERVNKEGRSFKSDIGHVEDYRAPYNPDAETKETINAQKKQVTKLLKSKSLTKKQRKYLKLYFLKQMSMNDMADKFKCSKQAVNQVVNGGLHKLRKELSCLV